MASTVQKLRLEAEAKSMFDVARRFLRGHLNLAPSNIVIHRSDLSDPSLSDAHDAGKDAAVAAPKSHFKVKTGPITASEQTEIDDLSRMRNALYAED